VSANEGAIVSVCVAVIGNINVIAVDAKQETLCESTIDCLLLLFRLQRECQRRDALRIPQCEEGTPQAVVTLEAAIVRSLHCREAAENIPVCVGYQSQSVRAAVAEEMEFLRGETVAAVPPQQFETLRAELFKQRRKVRDDQRLQSGAAVGERLRGCVRRRCDCC
jgi:hypothetical protein